MSIPAQIRDVPLPSCSFKEGTEEWNAYDMAVKLERAEALWGRILGWMLIESAFSPDNQLALAKEILFCSKQDNLVELAHAYQETFLLPCEPKSNQRTILSFLTDCPLSLGR